jgi:hypothetical protein
MALALAMGFFFCGGIATLVGQQDLLTFLEVYIWWGGTELMIFDLWFKNIYLKSKKEEKEGDEG